MIDDPLKGYAVRASAWLLQKHGQPWWTKDCWSWRWVPTVCVVDYSNVADMQRRSVRPWRGAFGLYEYFIMTDSDYEGVPDHHVIDSFVTLDEAVSAAFSLVDAGGHLAAGFWARQVIEVIRRGEKPRTVGRPKTPVPFTWSKDEVELVAPAPSAAVPQTERVEVEDSHKRVRSEARLFLERFSKDVSDDEVEELVSSLEAEIRRTS